jgi:hypothetical protein
MLFIVSRDCGGIIDEGAPLRASIVMMVSCAAVQHSTPTHQHTSRTAHQHTSAPARQDSTPAHQHTGTPATQAHQHTSTPAHQHTSTPAHQHRHISAPANILYSIQSGPEFCMKGPEFCRQGIDRNIYTQPVSYSGPEFCIANVLHMPY